jgi:ketosteroid isomerase-like protein
MLVSRVLLLVGLGLVAACNRPAPQIGPSSEADVASVRRLLATFDSCARTGALDEFISHATDDVVMLAPDQPAVVGKEAVREWYRGFYATFNIEGRHQPPVETYAIGDLVVARGIATMTAAPKAGGPAMTMNNKFIMLFRRQPDGTLRAWRVAFNSNAPAAAPPAAPTR